MILKTKFSTVARCVILIVALINQVVAAVLSAMPVVDCPVYQAVSVAVTAISSVIAAWKNNDFTRLARISGGFFKALKDGKITADEAEELVAEILKENGGSAENEATEEDNEK